MKKIEIEVKKIGAESTWTEEYEIDSDNTDAWALKTIQNFNATLRPGEKARELVSVKVLADVNSIQKKEHEWEKTNLYTIIRGSQNYDTMKCSNCHITAKRFGLGDSMIKRDSKYRAKKYEHCQG